MIGFMLAFLIVVAFVAVVAALGAVYIGFALGILIAFARMVKLLLRSPLTWFVLIGWFVLMVLIGIGAANSGVLVLILVLLVVAGVVHFARRPGRSAGRALSSVVSGPGPRCSHFPRGLPTWMDYCPDCHREKPSGSAHRRWVCGGCWTEYERRPVSVCPKCGRAATARG